MFFAGYRLVPENNIICRLKGGLLDFANQPEADSSSADQTKYNFWNENDLVGVPIATYPLPTPLPIPKCE